MDAADAPKSVPARIARRLVRFFGAGHHTGMVVFRAFVFISHISMCIKLQNGEIAEISGHSFDGTDAY